MSELKMYRGIKGLEPRRGATVVVANGKKGEKGAPIERDRFHLVESHENKNKIRAYHAAYAAYNAAAPEKRRTLYGILIHTNPQDTFWHQYQAQQLPVSYYQKMAWFKNDGVRPDQQTVANPNKRPCCAGNGEGARRWMGPGPDDFKDIPCPGQRCEFAIKVGKARPPCGPKMSFMFQLRWMDDFKMLSPATARYDSKGWETIANFLGFFEEIRLAVAALRIKDPVLYGFPFIMSIGDKTKPSEHWNWPVISISPVINPLDFFQRQREQIRQLSAPLPEITIAEELEIRPTVYLMDEAGPIRIGGDSNAPRETVVDAEVVEVEPSLFPENWAINKKYRTVAVDDLKKLLDTNQRQEAIYEMFFRVASFEKHFQEKGAHDDWKRMTFDGDVRSIPITPLPKDEEKICLPKVVTQLTAKWQKLSALNPNKKAA